MTQRWRIALAVVIALAVIAYTASLTLRRYRATVPGMWVGDPGFLKRAQLSDMQLLIPPEGTDGYLIMTDADKKFVINEAVTVHYSLGGIAGGLRTMLSPASDTARGTMHIETETNLDVLPQRMKMTVCASEGSMTLSADGKIYALLYKDNVASRAANLAYEVT